MNAYTNTIRLRTCTCAHGHTLSVCAETNMYMIAHTDTHFYLHVIIIHRYRHWHVILTHSQSWYRHWHVILTHSQPWYRHWHVILTHSQPWYRHWHVILTHSQSCARQQTHRPHRHNAVSHLEQSPWTRRSRHSTNARLCMIFAGRSCPSASNSTTQL